MRIALIRHGRTEWNAQKRVQGTVENHDQGLGQLVCLCQGILQGVVVLGTLRCLHPI